MSLGVQGAVGLLLVVGGAVLGAPLVVVLGLAALVFDLARAVWSTRGLDDVVYERRLGSHRAVVGDAIPLAITVWNRKPLPLAWLRAEDGASAAVQVRERALVPSEEAGLALRNAWSLAPWERVVRHFTIEARRRGVHELGPVRLAVGDLFAAPAAAREAGPVDRWVVRPRSVPVRGALVRERWGGDERARRGPLEHPISYAGVRDYVAGDPLRRIHGPASARLGRPVVKRFDPAREREVLLALDIQTVPGAAWEATYVDDAVEGLCVAAASIARRLRDEGASFGLAVAGYAGTARAIAYLSPSESSVQHERVLDLLARLSSFPSAPFERLLGGLPRRLRPGATVLVLTARDPAPFGPILRRLGRLGYGVTVLRLDDGASAATASAPPARAGLPIRHARLDGPWQSATSLVIT